MYMKYRLERFLTNWWLGLRSPWTSPDPTYSLIDWEVDSGQLNINKASDSNQNDLNYYQVPKQQALSSAVRTEQAGHDLASIVSATLPFDHSEVYATVENNTLFAVLKTDIEPIQFAATSQGIELAGLIFGQSQDAMGGAVKKTSRDSARLDFSAPAITVISVTKFLSALGVLALVMGGMLWKYSDGQYSMIVQLQSQLSESQAISKQPEQTPLSLTGARTQNVIKALQALKETVNEDTNLHQILLQSNGPGLSVILDAESINAASLLTLFEQNPQFQNSEFVTAISSDARNKVERFRLKTHYIIKRNSRLNNSVSHD